MKKYTDQEFLYRQTPVNYDGIAKFTSIKGNTLGWNQFVQNGNFADSSLWTGQSTTISISNNIANVTLSAKGTYVALRQGGLASVTGHKYLVTATFKCTKKTAVGFYLNGQSVYLDGYDVQANTLTKVTALINGGESGGFNVYVSRKNELDVGDVVQVSNVMLIDLTQMYGSGNEPTADEFLSLFSLPYYDYNQGTLIPFSGNGIKTTGKNLINYEVTLGTSGTIASGSVFLNVGTYYIYVLTNPFFASFNSYPQWSADGTTWTNLQANATNDYCAVNQSMDYSVKKSILTIMKPCYIRQSVGQNANTNGITVRSIITMDGSDYNTYPNSMNGADFDSFYIPYVEPSTTSLPTLTYFPTGMKSAGSVYDELTESKAITRVGSIDLGSMSWTAVTQNNIIRMRSYDIKTLIKYPSANNQIANMKCARYMSLTANNTYDGQIGISCQNNGDIYVYDSAYSTAEAFTTAMSGVYLYYELATETETDTDPNFFYKFYGNGTEEILPSALLNGVVDLGSLTWIYDSANTRFYTDGLTGTIKRGTSGWLANLFCEKYTSALGTNVDKTISEYASTGYVYIKDTSYTNATAFKNSLSGVLLYYQKSDSTPATSPIIADIEYYNQTDSEIPYRKFWLVNGNGERWNLTEKELKSFLDSPQGLGFQKSIDVTRYGERAYKNTETYNFPQVSGDVFFYDTANATRYEKYNEFVRFLMVQPLTLYYQIPVSIYSGIADIYTLDCEVINLTKTESKTNRVLTSNIQINGLGFYQGDTVEINGTSATVTINNDGDFPVGFEIELNGDFENPYITLEQDGELYGEAKFDDDASNFSSVYVNSKDGEQNVVLKQDGSILPNPLAYQDLSISNGSVYVTFVKLAKGESTLKIGADSYSISNYSIKFTPMYRSV